MSGEIASLQPVSNKVSTTSLSRERLSAKLKVWKVIWLIWGIGTCSASLFCKIVGMDVRPCRVSSPPNCQNKLQEDAVECCPLSLSHACCIWEWVHFWNDHFYQGTTSLQVLFHSKVQLSCEGSWDSPWFGSSKMHDNCASPNTCWIVLSFWKDHPWSFRVSPTMGDKLLYWL